MSTPDPDEAAIDAESDDAMDLINTISPLLAGHPPGAVLAALAALTARGLAGHFMTNREATTLFRDRLLHEHTALIIRLIGPSEAEVLHRTGWTLEQIWEMRR